MTTQRTILTVDDAATMRKMISFSLEKAGYKMLEAENGAVALDVLRSHKVDMIISDVNMPVMDGLEFTRQARLLPGYARTPIILLTTEGDPEIKNRGRLAGATGWIVKPFQQGQLVAIAAKVLPAVVPA